MILVMQEIAIDEKEKGIKALSFQILSGELHIAHAQEQKVNHIEMQKRAFFIDMLPCERSAPQDTKPKALAHKIEFQRRSYATMSFSC